MKAQCSFDLYLFYHLFSKKNYNGTFINTHP
jgi:hypothetical protein